MVGVTQPAQRAIEHESKGSTTPEQKAALISLKRAVKMLDKAIDDLLKTL